VPEYKIEEKFEDFGGTYNQFNKRELASIDSLLFGSTEKKRVINGSELFDTNEKRMLEEERSKYMQFVCDQMSGFIPQILLDEAAFTQACKRSGKRTKLTKKRMVEVDEEGNPIEQKEVVFHSMGEDDDEEDDVTLTSLITVQRQRL